VKTVLVVDHDISNLSMISALFKSYQDVRVLGTDSVRRAANILKKVDVGLVLIELAMPEDSGFRLMAFVRKRYPDLPLLSMTRHFTPAIEARIRHFRPIEVFHKPIKPERFMARMIELMALRRGYTIQGISLSSYLQLIGLEQKTCTLLLTQGKRTGTIYCENGDVVAAQSNGTRGTQAVYDMLFWEDAMIEVTESCETVEREINLSITHLLIEGHCRRDEAGGGQPDPIPADTVDREETGSEYGNCYLELTGEGERPFADGLEAGTVTGCDRVTKAKNADAGLPYTPGQSILPLGFQTTVGEDQGVDAYAVYDEHDNLKARSDGADQRLTAFTPSVYFEAVGKLNGMLGSGLKYINIQSCGKKRYAMFQCHRHVVVAAMRAHSRPADLIRTFKDAIPE
jgi:CheY-like chemotaxis protein